MKNKALMGLRKFRNYDKTPCFRLYESWNKALLKKGCYTYKIPRLILPPTPGRLSMKHFSPYSAFYPDDLSPAFTLNANLILLFEIDYYYPMPMQRVGLVLYLTYFPTPAITPIISNSSAVLIESFVFDFWKVINCFIS